MTVIGVCSVKGAPGATVAALAMTSALHHREGECLLVEADAAGGDVAAMLGLPTDPGMVSLAASSRHRSSSPDVHAHAQALPGGGGGLLGSTDPAQASAAIATLADRLPGAIRESDVDGVIDCGRWSPASPATGMLAQCDATVVCLGSSLQAIEAVRVRAGDLWGATDGRVGLVLVGHARYGSDEIASCTGLPVLGVLPPDRKGYIALLGGPLRGRVDRTQLVRSASSIVDAVGRLVGRSELGLRVSAAQAPMVEHEHRG